MSDFRNVPPTAYALLRDQVILTVSAEGGPAPGIYGARDFIARWREWTGERPARAWRTLFEAVALGGERFDYFLLDDALRGRGESVWPDPFERLLWRTRTAAGLDRHEEALALADELAAAARTEAEVRAAERAAAEAQCGALLDAARHLGAPGEDPDADELSALAAGTAGRLLLLGDEMRADRLANRFRGDVVAAILIGPAAEPAEPAPSSEFPDSAPPAPARRWREALLAAGAEAARAPLSARTGFRLRLWRAAAMLEADRRAEGLAELAALLGPGHGEDEALEAFALLTAALAGGRDAPRFGTGTGRMLAETAAEAALGREEAVLPPRTPGEALWPAAPLAESIGARRAEAARLLRVSGLISEGSLLELDRRLTRHFMADRLLHEELLHRVIGVVAAAGASQGDPLRAKALERLEGRLRDPARALNGLIGSILAEARPMLGDGPGAVRPGPRPSEVREVVARAFVDLVREAAGLPAGATDCGGRTLARLAPGCALALLLAPAPEFRPGTEAVEAAGAFVDLPEPFGGLPAGPVAPGRLIARWRRDRAPLAASDAVLGAMVRAGECLPPRSADMRLFGPLLERRPELFGGDVSRRLWRARIATGEAHWREAEAALLDFMAGRLLGLPDDGAASARALASAALTAARIAAGRLAHGPERLAPAPYAEDDLELALARLEASPHETDRRTAAALRGAARGRN